MNANCFDVFIKTIDNWYNTYIQYCDKSTFIKFDIYYIIIFTIKKRKKYRKIFSKLQDMYYRL